MTDSRPNQFMLADISSSSHVLLTESLSSHGLHSHASAYHQKAGFRSVFLLHAAAQHRPCSASRRVCCQAHETAKAASAAMQSLPEVLDIAVNALGDEDSFLEMSLKGRVGPGMPWRQLTIRPVLLRGTRQIQVAGQAAIPDLYDNPVILSQLFLELSSRGPHPCSSPSSLRGRIS